MTTRELVHGLLAEYGLLLDENRLEEWTALFLPDCDYRIVIRENVEQGLPNVLVWCDNRAMLEDRIQSYRNVNEYNLHWDRHVIGPARIRSQASGEWLVEAGYSLFQTDLEGASRLFSVGRYQAEVRIEAEVARFKSMLIVADTGLIPTLLATPI
jgi:anthranilate 1,2-dioxygenase small subunit